MHVLKSTRQRLFYLSLAIWLLSFTVYADMDKTETQSARLSLQDNNYYLSADLHFHFSRRAIDALQNGVPLFWSIRVKVYQKRGVLWDKTLADKEIRYRLRYHALLNMYRVKNETSGDVYNFSTLAAAVELMSTLRDFKVISSNLIRPESGHYLAGIKITFNHALPLPLRPLAYFDSQWYLSSDWFIWPLTK